MLPRAVVVDRARRPAFLLAAFEVVFRRRSLREQAAHGVDLRRLGAMRRARDRDLRVVEVGPRAGEQQRLDRLRTRAEEADELRIAGGRDDLAVTDGDCVDAVARLHGAATATDTLIASMARRLKTLWPQGGLWRHPDFLKLWAGQTISQFGSQISALALPIAAIVVLDASAFQVALLGTVEFLPFLLFTLPAGVWVDRLRRRPILVIADLGRAAALVSVPVAYAFDALTIWQLYAVGFVVGTLTVFFDVAYQSYLPSLVRRNQLVEGNSKLELSVSAAQLGGPGRRPAASSRCFRRPGPC